MPKAPQAADAVTADSVRSGITRVVKHIKLCLDGELMGEIEQLSGELQRARVADDAENRPAQAPRLAARIVELTEQAQAKAQTFSFQHMGRRTWRDLVAEHPPSEADKKAGGDFNTETFPVAAMAKSCIAPTGTTEAWFLDLAEELTDEQWNLLWRTCHDANTGGADVPLSVAAFAIARGTETNSAQRGSTEPAEASS